jgi:hypothetical protein
MTNFLRRIENETEGELVIGCIISHAEGVWSGWEDEGHHRYIPAESLNRVLPWDEAKKLLDYEYNEGYGSVDSHAITAWTENWVIFVGCYDGSSWVDRVPRHPVDHVARTVGGG